jgi:hypothetical protein
LCAISPFAAPCTAWDLVYPVAFIRIRAGDCIIPQNRIFAYNKFVRRIFTLCLAVKHKENDMRRMFGFMIGIVVGALIGSTVALLLAPETGEKFRSELRARGEILVNDVRNAAEARRIELTEQLESMRAPRTS